MYLFQKRFGGVLWRELEILSNGHRIFLMADALWINGRFTTTEERVISVEDRGFQFGDGIYEVLKFIDGRALFVADHERRMLSGVHELEIRSPWTNGEFRGVVDELLRRTAFDAGLVYVQVTRGVAERTHFYPEDIDPTTLLYSRSWIFPTVEKKEAGIAVITTEDLRWSLCRVKSINLLANVLAKKMAQRAGAMEALLVEDGRITEGAGSSFFGVRNGVVVTHPGYRGILPGTVCEHVVGLARMSGIALEERAIAITEIDELEEAFVTSTTQGVMPVTRIDGRLVGEGSRGPVTGRLQELFDALEASEAR